MIVMRRHITWFVLIVALTVLKSCSPKASPKASAGSTTQLSILTYNIHHANPPSKPGLIDLDAIARVIRTQQPDLVALQEVDVHTNRSGKDVHEAEEIARRADMPYHYFARAIDYDGGEYGVAVLSKFPFEETKNNPLPTLESTGGEHRTLATVSIKLGNGQRVLFACTHLDAQGKDTNRVLQMDRILALLNESKLPVILAGDLNAQPGSRVIDALDAKFTRTCTSDCGFTIPEIHPDKTIDFVAFRPAPSFQVVTHKVVKEEYASDHLPVLTVLRVSL